MLYGGEPAIRQPDDSIDSQKGLWQAIDAMPDHHVVDMLMQKHPYAVCRDPATTRYRLLNRASGSLPTTTTPWRTVM